MRAFDCKHASSSLNESLNRVGIHVTLLPKERSHDAIMTRISSLSLIFSLVSSPPTFAPDTEYTQPSSMALLWYVKLRNKIRQISRKTALNSFDRERLKHPASPASPAITRPSSSFHPGSSILIDGHLEGLLTENQAHHGTGKESTEGGRCTYIFSR